MLLTEYYLFIQSILMIIYIFLCLCNLNVDIVFNQLTFHSIYDFVWRIIDKVKTSNHSLSFILKYQIPQGMPVRRIDPSVCSICKSDLTADSSEKVHRLNCTHVYPFL
ncbi:hypothetical protein MS3_00004782 [Schistosoma haematobium]|uniref:Uncharacterized protein n=1 Tax=Schistosoma haematobium TaxID=6185 RepID=A0A922IT83_SCHHA|nr:hypothetical protein MS3_00004782 [Schistosoma haematobium]KAH9586824.1 hypothetical protein MS3_00004782 [Schistosoma haematobium]